MEYAYQYADPGRLYLNATNRCANRCSFCVRYRLEGLGGATLWGSEEPDLAMLRASVCNHGGLDNFREFVWCGFGEPTYRLDLIQAAAPWLRSRGAKIRLNTNGHACLIHGRDVFLELSQAIDRVSVSLNAPNPSRYMELCRPDLCSFSTPCGRTVTPALLWDAVLDFLFRSSAYFEEVQASVVGFVLRPKEIEQCRLLARSLGVKQFRVR